MDSINVQILTDRAEQRIDLLQKLHAFDYLKILPEVHYQGDLAESFRNDESDVVLITSGYLGDGYRASEIVTTQYPSKSVVILDDDLSQGNLRQAVTSGASDIIPPTLSASELNDSIYRAHAQNLQKQERLLTGRKRRSNLEGKIVTVFSTKGGTGKTFVSTNLAMALTRQYGKRVVLVDLDLDYGGDATALNLPVRYSIADVVNQIKNIDHELIESYLLTHESGLKLLAANPEPGYNDYVNAEHIEIILQTLQSVFDYVVVDMAGRFMQITNPAFSMADFVLLVTTPEILALKNIKSTLGLFKDLNFPLGKIRIVLNKATKLGISRQDVESTLGFDVFCSIAEDVKGARQSQNEGKPYVLTYQRSATSRGVASLASALVNQSTQGR